MDPNLVSSTGLQLNFNETVMGEFLDNLKMRYRCLAILLHRHFFTVLWMPGNTGFDSSTSGHDSLRYGQVLTFN